MEGVLVHTKCPTLEECILIIMDTYIAPVSPYPPSLTLVVYEHHYPCHQASYIIPRTISTQWGQYAAHAAKCVAQRALIKHSYHLCPQKRVPIYTPRWTEAIVTTASLLLRDTSTIQTHKSLAQGHKHHTNPQVSCSGTQAPYKPTSLLLRDTSTIQTPYIFTARGLTWCSRSE